MFQVPQIHRFSWFWNNPGNGYIPIILRLTMEKSEFWRECVAFPPTAPCGAGQLGLFLSGSPAEGRAHNHSLLFRCTPSRSAPVLLEGCSRVRTDRQSPPEPMAAYFIQVHGLGIKRGTFCRTPFFSPRGWWCENSNSSRSLSRVQLIQDRMRMFLTLLDKLPHWGMHPRKLWLEEMKRQLGCPVTYRVSCGKLPLIPVLAPPSWVCLEWAGYLCVLSRDKL